MLRLSISHVGDSWATLIINPQAGILLLAQESYIYETQKQALGCFLYYLMIIYSPSACAIVLSNIPFIFFFIVDMAALCAECT